MLIIDQNLDPILFVSSSLPGLPLSLALSLHFFFSETCPVWLFWFRRRTSCFKHHFLLRSGCLIIFHVLTTTSMTSTFTKSFHWLKSFQMKRHSFRWSHRLVNSFEDVIWNHDDFFHSGPLCSPYVWRNLCQRVPPHIHLPFCSLVSRRCLQDELLQLLHFDNLHPLFGIWRQYSHFSFDEYSSTSIAFTNSIWMLCYLIRVCWVLRLRKASNETGLAPGTFFALGAAHPATPVRAVQKTVRGLAWAPVNLRRKSLQSLEKDEGICDYPREGQISPVMKLRACILITIHLIHVTEWEWK